MRTYKDFEKVIAILKDNGYEYRYNDNSGEHIFVRNDEEIGIEDYINEAKDASDYDKIISEIKETFSFINFDN